MLRLGDNFITSLNKVYGIYTLGFLGFVILMAILEVAGVSNTIIGWLFVAVTVLAKKKGSMPLNVNLDRL